ncbi:hypothetical protein LWC34_39700 [Kibdelosporangium philippinense]|uniref:Uncharacterized protein n=1 Tax=Kibdelosporangium philippinense TaxID=211113 RepID=A0ABS8ZMB8_9PSEU|nr:hypothetical protein [Kibdelosporangium philippinense]MCE7008894.1 hypothetical protein [Kibdelosporangium philippinense]
MIDWLADLRAKARRATSVLPLAMLVFGCAIIGEGLLVLMLWDVEEPSVGPFVVSDFYWPLAVPVCLAILVHKGRLKAGATYRYMSVAIAIAAVVCVAAVAPLAAVDHQVSWLLPGRDPGAVPRCALAVGMLVLASLERRWGTALVTVVVSVLIGSLWFTTGSLNVAGSEAELLPLFASVVAAHLVVPGLMLLSSREVAT